MSELHKTWEDRHPLFNPPYLKLGVTVTSINFLAGIDSGDTVILATNVCTIQLPSAAGNPGGGKGATFHIKNALAFAGIVTVDGSGIDKIDNSATALSLAQFEAVILVSDGRDWWILANYP